MGDRYELSGLKCGHCGAEQEEVYYAPSSGFLSKKCEKCGKKNWIQTGFHLKAITDEEEAELYKLNGFE